MIELPTKRSEATSYNPKLMIIYGKPKAGKSSLAAALDDNLIIDLEDGYRALSVMKVQARTAQDLEDIKTAILAKGKELKKAPYKFITIDNASRLEEMSTSVANNLYRNTPMGQSWGYLKDSNGAIIKDKAGKPIVDPKADVRMLPNGSGYLYLRQAFRKLIDMFKPLCETLILICHIKDKQIKKNGEELSTMEVNLAGKAGDIVCGEADAVGYLYREDNKTYLSFVAGEDALKEARPLHLRGKKFIVAESDKDNNVTFNAKQLFI